VRAALASSAPAAGTPIPGRYVVRFVDGVRDPAATARGLVSASGGSLRYVYTSAVKGFAASLPAAAAAALAHNPNVAAVEQDQVMTASTTQSGATWGIDRIDQRALPLDASYTYSTTASGVHAYIIDTGIMFGHSEFAGRATSGYDAVDGGSADDCNGHGTHVSGTVGGSTYGVAKEVQLVAVRVLDCGGSGSTSGVIAGVDWVRTNAIHPAVANMSLGGGASSTLDQAVSNAIASGVTFGIAAGNGDILGRAQDACTTSPARVASAITVSATDKTDTKASWANYGTCVDIFAPGVSITSSWYNGGTNTISGTSMATPHVVGAAALYLADHPAALPSEVASALTTNATSGVVKSGGTGSPNLLLYTGTASGGGGGGTVVAPSGLSASYSVTRGRTRVQLGWTTGTASAIDVYRNGGVIAAATSNSGSYSDNLGKQASGSYTYQVCVAGSTSSCSNTASVTIP
jgi:subtilisin family serine protease